MSYNDLQERKTDFKWHTREDIYSSFLYTRIFDVEFIDRVIASAFENFIVRAGTAIAIDELWQKVGEELEGQK